MSDYDPNYVPQKNYYLVGQKCLVFNSEGKLLLLKRSDKVAGAGRWNLLGGALDKNEDPISGIQREAMEEAQIKLLDLKPIKATTYVYQDDSVLLIGYSAKSSSDEIALNWEHDEYIWVTKEEALNMDIAETIKDLIKSL